MKKANRITNGLPDQNRILRLALGICPALAVSTTLLDGLGMGVAVWLVLLGSTAVIAALRKHIPDSVRIPAFIMIIAGFAAIVQMLTEAWIPALHERLGIYLPVAAVNCVLLGLAERFTVSQAIGDSIQDGLGMGLGFTLVLTVTGAIRELFGAGSFLGLQIIPAGYTLGILTKSPGGFFVFGCLIALLAALTARRDAQTTQACGDGDCEEEQNA